MNMDIIRTNLQKSRDMLKKEEESCREQEQPMNITVLIRM
jgi:hypothetical protein